ncbi:MAG: ATP-dependent DNA helicase RecG [Candidatus Izimaplasma sp.]|nr:ATP-dependent DNA helicase RecG [Candidatus Izimaplasma bacterium]
MAELESIKGIGPKLKIHLESIGIHDCFELLRRFPSRYEEFHIVPFAEAPDQTRVTLIATVINHPKVQYIRKNLSKVTFDVTADGHPLKVTIFNRPYIKNILSPKVTIVMTGSLDRLKHTFTATTLKLKVNFNNEIQPIYNVDKISDQRFQKLIREALTTYGYLLKDELPKQLREKYRLIDIYTLIEYAHHPSTNQELRQVTRRLKYEELFKFQFRMQYMRLKNKRKKVKEKAYHLDKIKAFIDTLPYELTPGQKQTTNEIIKDIKSPFVMNRLLQGDVGSGKTVVAAISIVAVLYADMQVALMAPTEILAKQHYQTFRQFFASLPFDVYLLHGKLKNKERTAILDEIRSDVPCLVVGTHALFSEDVLYHNLGYVITDEQHRFGVKQREKLRRKGITPDVLYMSATPIPRTLAISIYGDMDISTIKGKPKSRKPVETTLFKESNLDLVYKLMAEELNEGHQLYVVTPLIVESDTLQVKNAQHVYKRLSDYFKTYSVGLLHSKVDDDAKLEVMQLFYHQKIDILVSTTVIEVGVDVPNATMMIIMNAERFGLSQLHQLRGRVGRGDLKGYCLLIYDEASGNPERLNILEQTNNGFIISEEDLKTRGPGEFFGSKQSGVLAFKHADVLEDRDILSLARDDALTILKDKSTYTNSAYQPLYQYLKKTLKKGTFD